MKKIVIGIVGKHKNSNSIRTDTLIRDEVKQAIFDNGAIAIGILSPNIEIIYTNDEWEQYENKINKQELIEQISICNGIILQGGSTNEAYETLIARYCYDNDIPCLGICAGQNNIVRALGGTTYNIPNPEKHNKPFDEYVHNIKIDKKSKFYAIVKASEMKVNSRHKKAIKECQLLDMVAFCEDGYPEVVEDKNKKFYMGVRFHPESLYKKDEKMNAIFKAFINACKK